MEVEEEEYQNSTAKVIMAALSTLPPPILSDLTISISTTIHHHRRRLSSILSSPILFSLSLHHLLSLSLHHKSLLISRHLLSTLTFFLPIRSAPAPALSCRDLDTVLLLLLLSELRQHDPDVLATVTPGNWRAVLCNYVSDTMLRICSVVNSSSMALLHCIEEVARCRRFVGAVGCGGKEVAASVAAVVTLPSVEARGSGRECVICKEEMREGRDVCELPCQHLFHWMCILPWLRKRNTCPCCRYQLPTDDVIGEIGRLWEVLIKMGGGDGHLCGE